MQISEFRVVSWNFLLSRRPFAPFLTLKLAFIWIFFYLKKKSGPNTDTQLKRSETLTPSTYTQHGGSVHAYFLRNNLNHWVDDCLQA